MSSRASLGAVNEADINLMPPKAWMTQDTTCHDSDPTQRLLGSVQAKERREHREEEEPPPQRRRTSQSIGQQECIGVAFGARSCAPKQTVASGSLEHHCTFMEPLCLICKRQSRNEPLEKFVSSHSSLKNHWKKHRCLSHHLARGIKSPTQIQQWAAAPCHSM